MKFDQFMSAVKTGNKASRSRQRSHRRVTYEECSSLDQNADTSGQNIVLKKFGNYLRYVVHMGKFNSQMNVVKEIEIKFYNPVQLLHECHE